MHDGSPFTMDVDDDQDPETWAAVGGTRTLRELAEHAITHSGNLATNLLLDVVGRDEVADVLRLAGCSATTVVGRGIEDAASTPGRHHEHRHRCRPRHALMAAVARRESALGGPAVCEPVEEMLSRQHHLDQIPAGLPAAHRRRASRAGSPALARRRARATGGRGAVRPRHLHDDRPRRARGAAFVASIAADVGPLAMSPTVPPTMPTSGRCARDDDRPGRDDDLDGAPAHPLRHRAATTETTDTVVVTITDSDGRVGEGEAPQVWQVTGESLASATACIESMLAPVLAGHALDDREDLAGRRRRRAGAVARNFGAKAAVDAALHDLVARAEGTECGGPASPGRTACGVG